jgi:molybdenum cofactor biosynthesis enzyme MoaA
MVIEKKRRVPKAPKAIQIQTISGCNGNCVFCPNKKTKISIPYKELMDESLFYSIIDQCVDLGVRRISPYLMNEPLLDSRLPKLIKYITKHKKRRQYTKINSNGSLLNEEMSKGLLDSGLDKLHISVQGIDPKIYSDLMKLDFHTAIKNIDFSKTFFSLGGY